MLTRRLLHLRTRVPTRIPVQQPRIPLRNYATGPQAQQEASRNRAAVGVRAAVLQVSTWFIVFFVQTFDWRAAAVFVVTGIGLYAYFEREKAQVQERKRRQLSRVVVSCSPTNNRPGDQISKIRQGSRRWTIFSDICRHWGRVH